MIFNFQLIIDYFPLFIEGLKGTLQIAGLACVIGILLGTILALLQTSNVRLLSILVQTYVTLVRGTPMLVQILFAFYVLPQLGIRIDATYTAIVAIGLNSAAYISQIIRSGISSISVGQIEAAKTLGFTSLQRIRYIILPQAFRIALPGIGNELTTLVKDSSLASVIGVTELSKQGRVIISRTYDAITIFAALAMFYLLLTSIISLSVVYLEKRLKRNA